MADRSYWDPARETVDPEQRSIAALEQLKVQLARCYQLPFYRRHWSRAGFHPDQVASWADFTHRCPTINKKLLVQDQEAHPPFGSYVGVDRTRLARVQASTGTSGKPTLYALSAEDWDRAGDVFAMSQWAMGVRPADIVQFAFPFSLFFGGWGTLLGAQRVGAAVLPIGLADTRRHVELMYTAGSTIIEATPSYLLHMAEVAQKMGYDTPASPLRRAVVGGEPGGAVPATRARIMEAWGLESVCDSGSTSEMFPFCTNTECTEMTGPHLYVDEVWTEIVDPDDHAQAMPEGERGALVYTHLWRSSQPMIRFAPGDAAVLTSARCACGRTYPRLPQGVVGRVDDMMIVRGVNVYPSAIEQALRAVDGVGLEFRIFVDRSGELDEVLVQAEAEDPVRLANERHEIEQRALASLRYHCQVRLGFGLVEPGTFERTTLKAKRIVDRRVEQL